MCTNFGSCVSWFKLWCVGEGEYLYVLRLHFGACLLYSRRRCVLLMWWCGLLCIQFLPQSQLVVEVRVKSVWLYCCVYVTYEHVVKYDMKERVTKSKGHYCHCFQFFTGLHLWCANGSFHWHARNHSRQPFGRHLEMLATRDTWTSCWERMWAWLPLVIIHVLKSIKAFHPQNLNLKSVCMNTKLNQL